MKVKYYISTNKIGSKCEGIAEFGEDEWNEMTENEKDEIMQDYAFQSMNWGYEEVPD